MLRTLLPGSLGVLALLAAPLSASAADLRVPEDHASLAEAISAAASGDRILLADGTFDAANLTIALKDLEIIGTGAGSTRIRNTSPGGFMITHQDSTLTLRDLTVEGEGEQCIRTIVRTVLNLTDVIVRDCGGGSGGAVSSLSNARVNVLRAVFSDNQTFGGGAAIQAQDSSVVEVRDSFFDHNEGRVGGAVFLRESAVVTVIGCTFRQNEGDFGGAIHADAELIVRNSSFQDNVSIMTGGGTVLVSSNGSLVATHISAYEDFAATGAHSIASTGSASVDRSVLYPRPGDGCSGVTPTRSLVGPGCGATGGPEPASRLLTSDPFSGNLADLGGLTPTLAAADGSPAFDSVSCSLSVDQRGSPRPAGTRCDAGSVEYPLPLGSICVSSEGCESGLCADGVCCDAACGGECEACSVAAGADVDGTCAPRGAGAVCRPGDDCDAAEVCDGVSSGCPADEVEPAGTVCRAADGDCDVEELCDGTSTACPIDGFADATTECRAAAGDCDRAETCDGASPACPVDVRVRAGTECRAAAGDCDVAETCDGATVACPVDARAPSGTICRAASGMCDVTEACDGVAVACPEDAFAAADVECRPVAGGCDVSETCDGASASCPADMFVASGVECRASEGECDVTDVCDGASAACEDAAAAEGTECTPATCDDRAACRSGSCVAEAPLDCDDGDPCTADACDSEGGCRSTPIVGCGDAGVADAAVADAAVADAGVLADAMPIDAMTSDGGGGTVEGGGCGCRTTRADRASWPLAALLGLAIAWRRRPRRA
ncbi:MAG: choice-of-anchor Q domain-containing protein [Sandaracinaceae bacterium]